MTKSSSYRPDIDGLRAIAVLAVLFFHADLSFPGGFVGVDVFFVISGFLITRLIVAELERGTFTFKNFWVRRLRRIWPAASFMTLVTLLVGSVLLSPTALHQLATDAIPQMLMLANVQFMRGTDYFGISADLRALLHTWSLAVEEQFYLFHPFAVVFIWRWRPAMLLPVFVVLGLGSFFLSVATIGRYPSATFYLLPTRAWELLIGGGLALCPTLAIRSGLWQTLVGLLGAGLIAVPMFVYDRQTVFPGLTALPPCLGTGLLILAGSEGKNFVSRSLSWEPMRRIGLISYSLYLVHWPVLAMMRSVTHPAEPTLAWRVAVIPASFILAYLSWRFVENRFRKPHALSDFRRVVFGSAGIASLIIAGSLAIRSTDGWNSRYNETMLVHMSPTPGSVDWRSMDTTSRNIEQLTKPMGDMSHSNIDFFFWGDSHAMAISKALDNMASHKQLRGLARLRNATPPIPSLWTKDLTTDVATANDYVLEWIINNKIPNVIIAARWSSYADAANSRTESVQVFSTRHTIESSRKTDPHGSFATLGEGVRDLAEKLKSNGTTLWILLEVPRQRITPEGRVMRARLTGKQISREGVTLVQHRSYTESVQRSIERAAATNARLIDLAECFFPQGEDSSAVADNNLVSFYVDDDHVSEEGVSYLLSDTLNALMTEIASQTSSELNP